MGRVFRLTLVLGMLSAATCGAAWAGGASIVSISTPRGVQQAFILIKPDHPVASVILFAGGEGALGLTSGSSLELGAEDFDYAGNFLVRSREKFAGHSFMVAVVDTPSDHHDGMIPPFRISKDHAIDIGAVAEYMKSQASVPVWLVGTSAGTWSAARGAIGAGRDGIATGSIDGLVLTSTVTHTPPDSEFGKVFPEYARNFPEGVLSMALPQIRIPTFIMSHRDDSCEWTPPADAPALAMRLRRASKVEIAVLAGGDPPQSDECDAYAPHGYFGIEAQAVDTIARFINANSAHEP
jgi:pimeloyl-ACP methyl ester carboxylesterase